MADTDVGLPVVSPTDPAAGAGHGAARVPEGLALADTDPSLPVIGREPRRRRSREQVPVLSAAALLLRLRAEEAARHEPIPRRRRYHGDDDISDVLARVLRN